MHKEQQAARISTLEAENQALQTELQRMGGEGPVLDQAAARARAVAEAEMTVLKLKVSVVLSVCCDCPELVR